VGAQIIRIDYQHTNKQRYDSDLIYFNYYYVRVFSYGSGQQQIDVNKKCRQIAGNFDCHGDAAVRCRTHLPIEHIPLGFARSHCMLPSVICLRRITPAAAIVNELE
jgi:hypothetical protein